jgi:hypothetical protein
VPPAALVGVFTTGDGSTPRHWWVEGVDVNTAQTWLGHAGLQVTLAIYASAPASVDRAAADAIGERFRRRRDQDFRVGLPGFEPGTSASRTEPWATSPVLVRRRILEKILVNGHILDPSADRSRPRNPAVLQRSAPFPRQCALRREILLTQIGCPAFTVLIDVLGTLDSGNFVDDPERRWASGCLRSR